jgi:hypothetical protein
VSTSVRLVVFLVSLGFLAPLPAAAGQQQPVSPTPSCGSAARAGGVECPALPPNIQTDPYLAPALAQLLARSPTFRRQCAAVAAARHVRVIISAVAGPRLSMGPRARATITRFAHGLMRATIEIPMPSEFHELIPHELEHVIEQIEGLNLPALAESDGRRVMDVGDGLYETARAQATGRKVAAEMLTEPDPAVVRATRAWRALSSRAVRTGDARARNR